jgi:hypothetical protein
MQFFCDDQRHLICVPYTVENLHKMAAELKIGKHWFHRGSYPHYDIPKRRMKEIQAKCHVISVRRILEIVKSKGHIIWLLP